MHLHNFTVWQMPTVAFYVEAIHCSCFSRWHMRHGTGGWMRLPWNPTNSDLAKMVGITRWSVSHFLSHLRELGLIRRHNGLWIHREALETFVRSKGAAAQN